MNRSTVHYIDMSQHMDNSALENLPGRPALRLLILLLLLGFGMNGIAQALSVDTLLKVVDLPEDSLVNYLKAKEYFPAEKKKDAHSNYFYFTSIEKAKDDMTWVRSLSVMDVHTDRYDSRLLNYRTYNQEEYEAILHYLLSRHYTTTQTFNFGESRHTLYKRDGSEIRVKVTNEKMNNGKIIKAFELEMGK